MVFRKKGTEEVVDLEKGTQEKNEKLTEDKMETPEEEIVTYEDVALNHEKRLRHIESVLLQFRNSI